MAEEKKKRVYKDKAVVLDFDDTVVDFLSFLCLLHNKRFGTCVTPNDITNWDFTNLDFTDVRGNTVKGAELRETFQNYEKDGLYVGLDILGDADFALEVIKKLGYKIIILTARSEKYGKQTELNLIKNKIHQYVDEVHFKMDDTQETESFKIKKIKELSKKYNIQLFADDKHSTVQQVYDSCNINYVFLVEKSHNKDLEVNSEEIIKIRDIMEIVRYLKNVKKG